MYAYDNADRLKGLGRQFRSIATAPTLDPEDLAVTFGGIRADLDRAERVAVATLRGQGHSWAAIAAGLGMSRQAAHERYADFVRGYLDEMASE